MPDSPKKASESIVKPTVSVVIPLYNHEQYSDVAIESLIAQSTPPTEIIVVDDGSQDGSLQRAQQWAERDSRIVCWSHPNRGAHYTINAAIQRASGDYVSILNSDDCYCAERLELCVNALEENPAISAVCTGLSFINGAGKARRNKWYEQSVKFFQQIDDLSLALINGNFLMTTSNLFIRREVFAELGMFANLRYAHDLDFFLRLITHGREILWIDQPLLQYRMHSTNTISEDALKVKTEWAAVVAFFLYSFSKNQDWFYLSRLAEIADRHNLTRLLFFSFLQFRRIESEQVSPDAYLEDADFLKFMAETVQ